MAAVEKLTVSLEVSPEFERTLKATAEQIAGELAAEMAQGFDARIRSIVYDTMRQREMRLVR